MTSSLPSEPFAIFFAVMALYLVAAMTPGPNLFATLQASLAGGRRAGLAVATGIALCSMLWAGGSLLGLSLIFALAPWLYRGLVLLGALYLIWMGLGMLRTAWRPAAPRASGTAAGPGFRAGFRRGLLVNLANPKSAVFYSSLFAVAVPVTAPDLLVASLVGAVGLCAFAWYGGVASLVTLPPFARVYGRLERGLTALSGLVFLGFGLKLLSQRA
jgi:threonine/homoserine/homoserine lactone efflux protein